MIDARYIQTQTSGIGRYTEHLIGNLLEINKDLRLRLITHPSQPEPFKDERIDCQVYKPAPNSIRTRYQLNKKIDFTGVELFHSPFNILPQNLPLQSVFTLHDIMWLIDRGFCTDSKWRKILTGSFYGKFIPDSVQDAAGILTVSRHSKEAIEDYFPGMKGKVKVTYNGVDPIFTPMDVEKSARILRNIIPPGKKFVLVVGQGSPYKNHAGALRAFLDAFPNDPDIVFVLVRRFQRGPGLDFVKLRNDSRMHGRFIHLEHVPFEVLLALYSAAHVFLFPSFYEGFGLPALEAMACGTPVLTSDRGALKEVGGSGSVQVNPESREALSTALRELFEDEEHHDEMRQKGLRRASEFSWRRTAEQALEAFEEIHRPRKKDE